MVMNYGRLPVDEQVAAFREVLLENPTLAEVLTRAAVLGLPGWYLVAGCLYQTVWNIVTGRLPEAGILDYDLAYFEATTACLGVRVQPSGRWLVYAPHGLADVFNLTVRPNPVLAPRHVYQAKAARWQQQWPSLTVLPWPAFAWLSGGQSDLVSVLRAE